MWSLSDLKTLKGFPVSKPRGRSGGQRSHQHMAQGPPVMGPECAGTTQQDFAGCSQDTGLEQDMLMAAGVTCLQGKSVQPPPPPDTQHYELCWLTGGTEPQPGQPSTLLIPLPFPARSPVRISMQAFPSSLAWGHPGMLTLPTDMFTAWKITHTGTHFWEHISILQAWLKGKVPTELSRGNPWD